MSVYIAGGAVRDLLLGRQPRDVDLLFTEPEEDFIQANPKARKVQSGPFPVYLLQGREYAPLCGGSLAADMRRRDFTVNALALGEDGVLHAHPAALSDLRRGLLRPCAPKALDRDPVRVLRAARLYAELPDFTLHPECLAQMARAAARPEFFHLAAEQAGKETCKACAAAVPGNFLRALHRTSALLPWFRELETAHDIPAGPPAWHAHSVLEHTALVMDSVARTSRAAGDAPAHRALAVWMALCHDLGKTTTPADLLPRHTDHEVRGQTLARSLGHRLRLPALYIRAGALAARWHMLAGRYRELRPGTRTDLLTTLHAARLTAPLFTLAAADAGDAELPDLAARDLAVLLQVRLPEEWRGRGAASGRRLRELRSMALAAGGWNKPPA